MDTSAETYNTPFLVNRGIRSSWDEILYPWDSIPHLTVIKVISAAWSAPTLIVDTEEEWFWTEEWQAGEREADKDITQGRYARIKTINELLCYLDDLEKEDV